MARTKFLKTIRERVLTAPKESIFVPSDFMDLAETGEVNMCLKRLVDQGLLRRVGRGIYERIEEGQTKEEFSAYRMEQIAFAIARNFDWTIIPSENTALAMLGLASFDRQEWHFVSDGPYHDYQIESVHLVFKHVADRDIVGVTYKSALVIQAMRELGKEKMDREMIWKFAQVLTDKEKEQLRYDTAEHFAWIHEMADRIYREGKSDVGEPTWYD